MFSKKVELDLFFGLKKSKGSKIIRCQSWHSYHNGEAS